MSFHTLKIAVSTALLLSSTVTLALPFSFMDPRSMAMGGAGVAVADAATAPLFNPALLSVTRYSDDFSLVLPSVGVYAADSKDLASSVDKFTAGNYVNTLQTSVSNLNTAIAAIGSPPTTAEIAAVGTSAATVSTDLSTLSTQLNTLNNKPVTLDASLSTVVGIPNKKFGLAFYANGAISSGAGFQYKDAVLLSSLSTQTRCLADAAALTPEATAAAAIAACGTPSFSTNSVQSTVTVRGVTIGELGFAISREYLLNRHRVALGITPKIIQVQLYDIPIGLNSPSLSNLSTADYRARYSVPNFDLGAAKNYRNGWRSGLVIKNVIPYFLEFKRAPVAGATPVSTGESLRLIPQTRVGISHTNRWSTVALDVDLYRNDPVGVENYTQYIALGGELNGWNWGQLRAWCIKCRDWQKVPQGSAGGRRKS